MNGHQQCHRNTDDQGGTSECVGGHGDGRIMSARREECSAGHEEHLADVRQQRRQSRVAAQPPYRSGRFIAHHCAENGDESPLGEEEADL